MLSYKVSIFLKTPFRLFSFYATVLANDSSKESRIQNQLTELFFCSSMSYSVPLVCFCSFLLCCCVVSRTQ